jgi:hypothetical protein
MCKIGGYISPRARAAVIMKSFAALFLSSTLFVTAALAQQTKPIPYGNNPAAGKYHDINGFKMYTEVYGSGPPLLMIHGNNGSMNAFERT